MYSSQNNHTLNRNRKAQVNTQPSVISTARSIHMCKYSCVFTCSASMAQRIMHEKLEDKHTLAGYESAGRDDTIKQSCIINSLTLGSDTHREAICRGCRLSNRLIETDKSQMVDLTGLPAFSRQPVKTNQAPR